MTIQRKAEKYNKMFISATRQDGESFVKLTDDAPERLRESIRAAHGERFPNDWIYGTYADLMQKVTEYDLETIEELEDSRNEIVNSQVDVYTSGLTEWLDSNNNNVYYLTDVLEEYGGDIGDGFKLLAMAQYKAIDEVMNEVVNLLSN